MTTETETEETTSTGDVWPPVAHIVNKKGPCKKGDKALCGATMMGIDLKGMHCPKVCQKCTEIAVRLSR